MCMYVCMYIYIYICIHICIEREREMLCVVNYALLLFCCVLLAGIFTLFWVALLV